MQADAGAWRVSSLIPSEIRVVQKSVDERPHLVIGPGQPSLQKVRGRVSVGAGSDGLDVLKVSSGLAVHATILARFLETRLEHSVVQPVRDADKPSLDAGSSTAAA